MQRIRLAVKPGMTDLDSISVGGDLAILLRTPAAIARGEGSH